MQVLVCVDAGGGRPLRREISAEYVRFKTGRIYKTWLKLLPLRLPAQDCAFMV